MYHCPVSHEHEFDHEGPLKADSFPDVRKHDTMSSVVAVPWSQPMVIVAGWTTGAVIEIEAEFDTVCPVALSTAVSVTVIVVPGVVPCTS